MSYKGEYRIKENLSRAWESKKKEKTGGSPGKNEQGQGETSRKHDSTD